MVNNFLTDSPCLTWQQGAGQQDRYTSGTLRKHLTKPTVQFILSLSTNPVRLDMAAATKQIGAPPIPVRTPKGERSSRRLVSRRFIAATRAHDRTSLARPLPPRYSGLIRPSAAEAVPTEQLGKR